MLDAGGQERRPRRDGDGARLDRGAGRWRAGNLVDGFDSRRAAADRRAPDARRRRWRGCRRRASTTARSRLARELPPRESLAEVDARAGRAAAAADRLRAATTFAPAAARSRHRPAASRGRSTSCTRGDVDASPASEVGPGALSLRRRRCRPRSTLPTRTTKAQRRAALARWLTDPRTR